MKTGFLTANCTDRQLKEVPQDLNYGIEVSIVPSDTIL